MRNLPDILATVALTLLLGVVPATGSLAATPEPPPPDPALADQITWGIVPADAEGVPDGRVSFRLSVDPGEQVTEHLVVTNYSQQAVTFGLLASDGVVTSQGVFDLLPSDTEPVDVGSWIELPATVEVAAGASVAVPFTVSVPAEATPGDHPGGIVASLAPPESDTAGPQVGVDTRVGVRVHLRVTGELAPALTINDLTTRYETSWNPFAPGTMHVDYTVSNDGNVRLSSIQTFEVLGPFGLSSGATGPSGSVVGQQREILPGQTSEVSTTLTGVWPLAQLTTSIRGLQDTVGDDVVGAAMPDLAVQTSTLAIPWPQLAVLVLLVVGIIALVRRRNHHRARLAAALARARAEGARQAQTAQLGPAH